MADEAAASRDHRALLTVAAGAADGLATSAILPSIAAVVDAGVWGISDDMGVVGSRSTDAGRSG